MGLSKAVSITKSALTLTAILSVLSTNYALAAEEAASANKEDDTEDSKPAVKAVNEKILPLINDAYKEIGRGESAKAVKTLVKALNIDPDSITARRYLAFAMVQAAQYVPALTQMQKLSKITPMNAFDWYVFGEAYAGAGALSHSQSCYQQALAISPGYHAARGGAVKALVKEGLFTQALQEADKGVPYATDKVVKKYYAALRQGVLDAQTYQKDAARLGSTQGVSQEQMEEQASKPVLINPSMSEGDN
jgi:tetratricopeptide (TPR) repeat protein